MVTEGTFLPARRAVSCRPHARQGRSQSSRHFVMAQAPPLTATAPFRKPAPIREEGTTTASAETHTRPQKGGAIPFTPHRLVRNLRRSQQYVRNRAAMNSTLGNSAAENEEHASNSPADI